MVLSDHFTELLRAQLIGERAASLSRPAAVNSVGPALARGAIQIHPLNTTVICWPPRRMVICQARLGELVTRSSSRVLVTRSLFTATITSPRWKPRLRA